MFLNDDSAPLGFSYQVYDGTFDMLPDFSSLQPIASGISNTISTSVTTQTETFGLVFSRKVTVPTAGKYTFATTSDDGSKLYLDGNLVVNNDGLHGARTIQNTVFLNSGEYDLRVEFFEKFGGQVLSVSINWAQLQHNLFQRMAFCDNGNC